MKTIGTTNSAMSQKMPTPLWMKTMRRAAARRIHLRGMLWFQSDLCGVVNGGGGVGGARDGPEGTALKKENAEEYEML